MRNAREDDAVNADADRTVWRCETAPRAAVLVDVAEYYAAARSAMAKAQRSIHLLNWEFESRTRLEPVLQGGAPAGERIGDFLKARAEEGIDVRILCWKTALPVAAGQDWFPLQDRRSFAGTKVKFVLDGGHPFGACHHQKAIIVDDAVAFCGGADIGQDRWDTTEHRDDDPWRASPGARRAFHPRHEVMALVDGPPAAALGVLFRERWRRATGAALAAPAPDAPPPWPEGTHAEFTDVAVGVSRTVAAWKTSPEVRECEALTFASIAQARRTIYMENQYFTSPAVAEALALRLAEPDGPEVVLVSTRHAPSWFDRMTMDRTRGDFIRRLLRADQYGRLHVYSPSTARGRFIIVHAKFAIIDDDFVRVGSSNMNNRSTGFDTECDLSFNLEGEANRAAVARLRSRLVAHWLGVSCEIVDEAIIREGGLGCAIEAMRVADTARLCPIIPRHLGPIATFIAAFHIGDPVGPADSFNLRLRRRRLAAEVARVAAGVG